MLKSAWVVMVVVALLVVGCGPAMQPAAGPATESGEVFMVALPRIEVEFDGTGTPSIAGVKMADLARYGVAVDDSFKLNPYYVNWMTNANVQHVEMRQTGNGLALFINGKPMPHVGWTDESLQQLSDFAGMVNLGNTAMLRKFLPIVRRLGLDLVLRFPRQPGAADVALMDPNEALAVTAAKPSGPASAIVQFEVKYDKTGVPGILGISAADLAAMGINAPLAMHPDVIRNLQQNNIQNMEIRGKGDGLFLYVNGTPLPNIVWDDAFLTNAADAWVQMNSAAPQQWIEMVRTAVPLINKADIAIMIHFPLADGATPIAAKMHF